MTDPQVIDFNNAQAQSKTNSFFSRLGALLGMSQNGKRDSYDIFGYPQDLGGNDGFQLMYACSRRQGIANRITFGMAKKCWRDGFRVLADPNNEESEELVNELKQLCDRGLAKKLEQADILNRIGRLSVLLVGVPDGLELDKPVGTVTGDGLKSIYFKAFAYDGVTISSYDNDTSSPRYGLPEIYNIQRGQRRTENEKDSSETKALKVHWSRLVHLNENALDSEIEGLGALEPIFNRILDLDKACGGSSEAYFRNARGKVAFEIDKDFAATFTNNDGAKEKFDESARQFTNEWKDHIALAGAKAHSVDTPHYSPLDTVKVSLWEISGYTGIPIRILTGEGSGQMAGSEDQLAMNQIIADRQRLVCSHWVRQVLEILRSANILKLDDGWSIDFPQQKSASELQQAEIDNKKADTLLKVTSAISSPGGDGVEIESALKEVGLGSVEVDEQGFDDDIE